MTVYIKGLCVIWARWRVELRSQFNVVRDQQLREVMHMCVAELGVLISIRWDVHVGVLRLSDSWGGNIRKSG